MDPQTGAVSPEEAKARLRAAARRLGLGGVLRDHPWGALAAALAAGCLAGQAPALPVLRRLLALALWRALAPPRA